MAGAIIPIGKTAMLEKITFEVSEGEYIQEFKEFLGKYEKKKIEPFKTWISLYMKESSFKKISKYSKKLGFSTNARFIKYVMYFFYKRLVDDSFELVEKGESNDRKK